MSNVFAFYTMFYILPIWRYWVAVYSKTLKIYVSLEYITEVLFEEYFT